MKQPLLLSLLLLAACGTVANYEVEEARAPRGENPHAAAQLDKLKALEGDWVATGGAMPGMTVSYGLTAGGSTVVETLMEGTDHEMITMYYLDGDDLVLTHYCVLGNQPHMQARPSTDDTITFDCYGGGNLADHSAQHMHRGVFIFEGADRLRTAWSSFEGGEELETLHIELARR